MEKGIIITVVTNIAYYLSLPTLPVVPSHKIRHKKVLIRDLKTFTFVAKFFLRLTFFTANFPIFTYVEHLDHKNTLFGATRKNIIFNFWSIMCRPLNMNSIIFNIVEKIIHI